VAHTIAAALDDPVSADAQMLLDQEKWALPEAPATLLSTTATILILNPCTHLQKRRCVHGVRAPVHSRGIGQLGWVVHRLLCHVRPHNIRVINCLISHASWIGFTDRLRRVGFPDPAANICQSAFTFPGLHTSMAAHYQGNTTA
jgi:hypothetical protein